jgi:integrase
MWNRLMAKALAAKIVVERFTFHDLRAHYTTHFKLKFGTLPDMHADPATTAQVHDRSRDVRQQSL